MVCVVSFHAMCRVDVAVCVLDLMDDVDDLLTRQRTRVMHKAEEKVQHLMNEVRRSTGYQHKQGITQAEHECTERTAHVRLFVW